MIDRRKGIDAAIKYLLAKGKVRRKMLDIFRKEYDDYCLKTENQYRK